MIRRDLSKTRRWQIFVVGGIGCIAPNIINYTSRVMAGGTIPDNIIGLSVGGLIFFAIAGFLVAYILDANNIRDAFYKGVAVPTLIISLANGVTDKNGVPNVPVVPTTPSNNSSIIPSNERSAPTWFSASLVYAQTPAAHGAVHFTVSPKSVRDIKVVLLNPDGNAVARAQSVTTDFEIKLPEGQYTAALESGTLYKEVPIKITANETTMVNVELVEKDITNKISGGVKSLLKR